MRQNYVALINLNYSRSGFYDTAIKLSQQSGLENLTDIEVFLAAKEVEESLSKGK